MDVRWIYKTKGIWSDSSIRVTHETIQRIKNFVSTNYIITIDVEVSNRPGHFGYGYRKLHYSVDEFLQQSIETVAVIVNFEKSKGYKVVG